VEFTGYLLDELIHLNDATDQNLNSDSNNTALLHPVPITWANPLVVRNGYLTVSKDSFV